MDYENVYYVDSRNAQPVSRDHRTVVATSVPTSTRVITPSSTVGWTSTPSTTPYQYPAPSYYGPTMYPNTVWNPNMGWGYPAQPPYIMPPVAAPPSNLATILGGFGDIGTLANIVAQAIGALLPLPAAPTPADTSNGDTDPAAAAAVNSSNLIRYQNALALFARRDQQILTIGSVLKELFRRPGSVLG
jgi:hypothetical protein